MWNNSELKQRRRRKCKEEKKSFQTGPNEHKHKVQWNRNRKFKRLTHFVVSKRWHETNLLIANKFVFQSVSRTINIRNGIFELKKNRLQADWVWYECIATTTQQCFVHSFRLSCFWLCGALCCEKRKIDGQDSKSNIRTQSVVNGLSKHQKKNHFYHNFHFSSVSLPVASIYFALDLLKTVLRIVKSHKMWIVVVVAAVYFFFRSFFHFVGWLFVLSHIQRSHYTAQNNKIHKKK